MLLLLLIKEIKIYKRWDLLTRKRSINIDCHSVMWSSNINILTQVIRKEVFFPPNDFSWMNVKMWESWSIETFPFYSLSLSLSCSHIFILHSSYFFFFLPTVWMKFIHILFHWFKLFLNVNLHLLDS